MGRSSQLHRTAAWTPRALVAAAVLAASLGARAQSLKFLSDDPLQREPETQDASKVQESDIALTPDLLLNLFGKLGDQTPDTRAQNVNTIDEVPDSSWFTNRIYAQPLTTAEITGGPNTIDGPAPGRWTLMRAKSAGVAPGFTVRDANGETWFVSLDGRDNPIAPTAAAMVATRLFWALGYNQVETYLTTIRPEDVLIHESATIPAHGKRRRFTNRDLGDVFARAAKADDGSYRALVGRAVPGRPIGGFRYFGTRPDDPNDIVPHEHRRELRALQVFGAWTNLVDMKAGNTLDTVVTQNGRGIVRHYLQDVGSTFGTGALAPRDGDEGYEHLYDGDPVLKRFWTLGFALQRWQTVDFEEHPEIGKIEADGFEPEAWKPRVPVAALRHARTDDLFWAALRVMAFTDEQIGAAVKTGRYTAPEAEQLLTNVLIKRRDAIGRVYFARINPLVRFALSESGELTFENPAVRAGFSPKQRYEAVWASFNNSTGEARPIGAPTQSQDERFQAPTELGRSDQSFVMVSLRALEPPHAPWAVPVHVYYRRAEGAWKLIGIERGNGPDPRQARR